ncbi:MAG: helix-turn-helix domain-containing protein [Deltaproteobacteria bacterium]|nr:helix-turn-helix domain-containing protein [Deltaproteobacteria bacterium]
MNRAEKIYKDIITLPMAEREKLFSLIARRGFDKDYYAYEEVFDDIPSTFTIKETSEYMGVAEITIRRWAKEGKLPFQKVGKNYVFLVDDLRKLKQKMLRKSIKG